ncbi:MAG: class I SAM-dependent methyltransferase [Bacteroidetes bacterium]|nr:class I SAM-dependent methyltransferase [Bacteroidota bacterium]
MLSDQLQSILKKEVQDFIYLNEQLDENKLILSQRELKSVPTTLIAHQITGRRKAKYKLPTWYATPQIVYPPSLNLEQSSSEATAEYKRQFLLRHISKRAKAIDLTGGFGIDTFFFSKIFDHVEYVERNEELVAITENNHHQLGATNISYHARSAEEMISGSTHWDFIYIDPSRRDEQAKKLVRLSDTQPNVVELQNALLEKSDHILVKTSPLLDIQAALRELKFVKTVTVLSVDNECKELLFFISKNSDSPPTIEAVNILLAKQNQYFEFTLEEEVLASVSFSDPLHFIYEPNASILKAGAFKSIAQKFPLTKLSKSTHLYTSSHLIENFPGRSFKVIKLQPDASDFANIPQRQINVTTRNYPLSPEEIKKKYKLKDGGDQFLIGCSGENKKFLILAAVIKQRP